jgi:hypothetical protein
MSLTEVAKTYRISRASLTPIHQVFQGGRRRMNPDIVVLMTFYLILVLLALWRT